MMGFLSRSVAGGGGLLPSIGMQKLEITTFLALLSLISTLEWKIVPPPLAFPSLGYEKFFLSIWSITELGH